MHLRVLRVSVVSFGPPPEPAALFFPRARYGVVAFEVVPLVQSHRRRLVAVPGGDTEPARVLTELSRAYGQVALIDQEGVERNTPDLEFIQDNSRHAALWVDGGSRFGTDAMDVLVAGARRVTLRWSLLDSPDELEESADLAEPSSLALALEHRDGAFVRNRRARDHSAGDALARADGLGVPVIVIDVGGRAFNASLMHALPASATERWWAAVVDAPARLAELERAGFTGVLAPAAQMPTLVSPKEAEP